MANLSIKKILFWLCHNAKDKSWILRCYLFGSVLLDADSARDVDIIIVRYRQDLIKRPEIKLACEELSSAFFSFFDRPLHISIVAESEEKWALDVLGPAIPLNDLV